MKNELTPQIAALYLGQKCETISLEPILKRSRTEYPAITPTLLEWMINGHIQIVPHLRPLSTITEAEARELYEIQKGEKWNTQMYDQDEPLNGLCLEKWWIKSDEWYLSWSEFCIGSPLVWLKLLSLGFDLFGLIDAGLAKEIETKV